jgi:anaerobic ribonucleoside-triphosphate reductase activating protein
MLRFHNYDIVFQEIPSEVTLAINISGCPNRCKGCHSPHLWNDIGKVLDESSIAVLMEKYGNAITCICFMGGDSEPDEVDRLAVHLRRSIKQPIKTAWHSGKQNIPKSCNLHNFDYIKLGAYIEELGGLDSLKTNPRLYKITNEQMEDITNHFQKQKQ